MGCFKKDDPEKQASKDLDKKISKWMRNYNNIIKLLLLGPGESGKTTIIKQMRILHMKEGFTDEDRSEKVKDIRRNILEAIKELGGNMAFLQPPVELADENNRDSLNFINNINMMVDYVNTEEFYDHVKLLWSDKGIQEAYRRSNEFQLIDSAKYFLDKIDEIRKPSYQPSNQDILCSRKRTSEIQKIEFSVKVPSRVGQGGSQEFWMFDVGGQRGERRRWIQVFDGITAVLFLVASSGFDTKIREDNETNRLEEALKVFEEVWFSRFLRQSGFILFLNKQDVLENKIKQGNSLIRYYPDFEDYIIPSSEKGADNNNEYHRARSYIKERFLSVTNKSKPNVRYSTAELYYDLQGEKQSRKCFWHYTTATDTKNIQKVFDDVHVMIIMENLNKIGAALT